MYTIIKDYYDCNYSHIGHFAISCEQNHNHDRDDFPELMVITFTCQVWFLHPRQVYKLSVWITIQHAHFIGNHVPEGNPNTAKHTITYKYMLG